MKKKLIVAAVLSLGVFAFMASPALAAPSDAARMADMRVEQLQQRIIAADPTLDEPLNALTVRFLGDARIAGWTEDRDLLDSLVRQYALDAQVVMEQIDNSTRCAISFTFSSISAASGILRELASGNTTPCILINVTNKVVDLLSAKTKYDICIIDASEEPDLDARGALVQQLVTLETFDFITNAMDVFLCVAQPGPGDYISLIFNLLDIFKQY
jgi:hypothetical protein